jgi:ABC-type sugar transport system ATPase subunit
MAEHSVPLFLEMQGIEKTFYGTRAVNGVDFNCARGEVHGLVGENGAGKSTLMKVLVGVHSPEKGKILINGEECKFADYSEARKAGIGIVYQELSLLPQLTVAENITMGAWPKTPWGLINWKTIRATSKEILKSIGIEIDPDLLVSSLPIALRQMVEIAKVLTQKPELIIFDEPTAPLSHDEVMALFKLINDLKKQGNGVIFISHRLDEVLTISDRITVMKDGQKVITDAIENFNEKRLISSMVGRDISEVFPPKTTQRDKRKELFAYDGILNLSDSRVAFSVHEGEVLGVGGLQGQGQLGLLHSIFGLGGCENMRISINGQETQIYNPRQAMRHGIALVPENRNEEGIFLILSCLANLTATTIDRRQRVGFIDKRTEFQSVRDIVNRLSIKISSTRQLAQSLSGGNMQKLVLGKWLIFKPKIIVLCEPTKGVDVGTKQQVYILIRQLADSGVAVIVNTSEMIELIGLCDRVLIMNHGVLTANLSDVEITEEHIMEASVSNGNIISTEIEE